MRNQSIWRGRRRRLGLALLAGALQAGAAQASDHLDTPSVIANPSADIGDLYAWMAPDGRRLNLAMTIVGHNFSDRIDYVFHIDSGKLFGITPQSTTLVCRFPASNTADCRLGTVDRAHGDAGSEAGLRSERGRFRVFAGLRDDPFFNNVRGTRAAYGAASAALKAGAPVDAAGCPGFEAATVREIHDRWRHTDGGPAKNFLAGWTPASIVVQVDVAAVNAGGKYLGVWATTASGERQIDRAGRPLTGNALLGTIASDEESDPLKEAYNAATPATAEVFVPEIQKGLALYDGFDGHCGDQFLADRAAPPQQRYLQLAKLLAEDRLWVNSDATRCTQLFAVERAALRAEFDLETDCGGRTPAYDSVNVYRSLLANGTTASIDDGLHRDERPPSDTVFPFLAPPPEARP